MFTHAIVRLPAETFAEGLTTVELGVPVYEKVRQQHGAYCEALQACGLALTVLDTDRAHPDSTFVEDTAVVAERCAILTRPGANSRLGEVAAMRAVLRGFHPALAEIESPGTLDGGDICETETVFYLGLSQRSNQDGVRQLAAHLGRAGYPSTVIDVRAMSSILHLKSGISYIGDNTLVVMEEMADLELFRGYELIRVLAQESYAANCVRVNDRVLVAAGYPALIAELLARGFNPLELEMSEFQKMDGGLSCLSLRF